jgi:hypothetical protein
VGGCVATATLCFSHVLADKTAGSGLIHNAIVTTCPELSESP